MAYFGIAVEAILCLSRYTISLLFEGFQMWFTGLKFRRTRKKDENEARQVPSFKRFLISTAIDTEILLGKIDEINQAFDPIIYAEWPSKIDDAVLLLEDRRFFSHCGFDVFCIPRIIRQAITKQRIGGMSTIEQQLTRTILQRFDRTAQRKFREIIQSIILTYRLPKKTILRSYLSTAYLGHGVRGVDVASEILFRRPSGDMNIDQALFVASLLVYPLPNEIQNFAIAQDKFPITNYDEFFKFSDNISPRWSKRLKRRFLYGIFLYRQA